MSDVESHDDWLRDDSDVAALTMRQVLVPVEGRDAVIFPPTYPLESKTGYNIDRYDDGTSVCQVDSVGSQANRMEPIFKREKYRHLVPQVVIEAGNRRSIHLLDAGHRAADAIVRFSTFGPEFHQAFLAYRDEGDAGELARIAPTSIVFGSWDSRATQVKLPRIVRSVIRAYDVKELTRSAQYSTIAGEILADGEAPAVTPGAQETKESQIGLAHVPAVQTHGGIQVKGEIRREAILNLAALRAVGGFSEVETLALRRYILGLALVAFTAPMDSNLREGCELVPDPEMPSKWQLVKHDGTRRDLAVTHDQALAFATASAEFVGTTSERTGTFSSEIANAVMQLSKDEARKLLRQGPVTREAIESGKKTTRPKSKGKSGATR